MSLQPATPTSASMPHLVVVPSTVPSLGPQLSRLPDELLQLIFKFVTTGMFPNRSRFNKLITAQTFNILNHHYAVKRIRNVSTDFAALFMEAFYENFHFAFKHSSVFNLESKYLTSFPAPLPPPHFRHHLRSMRIEVALENYYFTPQTKFDVPRTSHNGRQSRRITTVGQMMAFCPSARFLLHLTDPSVGFGALRFLDLHIRTDFIFPLDEAFLCVLVEANFVFKANEVRLTVTDNADFVFEPQQKVKSVLGRE